MNEKSFFVFFICILLFSLSSCCTRSGIHNHGNGAYTVRENLGKLGDEQTQSATTNTELKGKIDRSLELVGEFDKFIKGGAGDLEEFKAILQRVRRRGKHSPGNKNKTDWEVKKDRVQIKAKPCNFVLHFSSFDFGKYRIFYFKNKIKTWEVLKYEK